MTVPAKRSPRVDSASNLGFGLVGLLDLLVRLPVWLRALVPIFGMSVIWWLSSKSPESLPHIITSAFLHNMMHVVAYGCIAGSVWLAWSRRPVAAFRFFRSRGAWGIAVLYGAIDELHQSFVPGRACSLADLVSDALGAALAVVFLRGASGIAPKWRLFAVVLLLASFGSVAAATLLRW